MERSKSRRRRRRSKKLVKVNAEYVETAIVNFYNPRTNLIIPNVSWGFLNHEADLIIISSAGYLTEIEIKISVADCKKDLEKRHGHRSNKIKNLYFAVPEYILDKCLKHIPNRSGVYSITSRGFVEIIRKPISNTLSKKVTIEDRYKLARLGALRIWGLKRKLRIEKQKRLVAMTN